MFSSLDFWKFITYFGDISYWLGFSISFLIIYQFLDDKNKKRFSWIYEFLIPILIIAHFSSFLLKGIFKVQRICYGLEFCPESYAFPSGHATTIFAFASTIFLKFRKIKFYLPAYFLALLVGYSRIVLNVHNFFDVLGGAFLGTSIAFLYNFLIYKIKKVEWFYLRKIIHVSAISTILLINFFPKNLAQYSILLLSFLYAASEFFRFRRKFFPYFQDIVKICSDNKPSITPFLFGFSIFLLLYFPEKNYLAGLIALIIGDGFAGLIGYKFGKIKVYNNKSIEGSLAFFLSTFLLLILIYPVFKSFILALVGMIIELFSKEEENLVLPLSISILSLFL